MQYYQEKETGDFLCADMSTLSYYLQTQGKSEVEGRATAFANLPRQHLYDFNALGLFEKEL